MKNLVILSAFLFGLSVQANILDESLRLGQMREVPKDSMRCHGASMAKVLPQLKKSKVDSSDGVQKQKAK